VSLRGQVREGNALSSHVSPKRGQAKTSVGCNRFTGDAYSTENDRVDRVGDREDQHGACIIKASAGGSPKATRTQRRLDGRDIGQPHPSPGTPLPRPAKPDTRRAALWRARGHLRRATDGTLQTDAETSGRSFGKRSVDRWSGLNEDGCSRRRRHQTHGKETDGRACLRSSDRT
jgi:hypothetical protein